MNELELQDKQHFEATQGGLELGEVLETPCFTAQINTRSDPALEPIGDRLEPIRQRWID